MSCKDCCVKDKEIKRLRERSIAYICGACGGFAYNELDSIDSGTTLTCDKCKGKTVVILFELEKYVEWSKSLMDANNAKRNINPLYLPKVGLMLKETSIPCTCQKWGCNFCDELYKRPFNYDWTSTKHTHYFSLKPCLDCSLWLNSILEDALRVYYGELPLYLGLFVAMFTKLSVYERMKPFFREGELDFCKEMFGSLTTYLSMCGCTIKT